MFYDAGLILSVAIGAWLALDVAMAEGWQRRSLSIGLLGGSGAFWAASELLIRVADAPAELAFCRRMIYLGASSSSFCWYWVSLEVDAPRWFQHRRWRACVAAVPLLFVQACLYLAPDGTVISLYTETTQHGPLYLFAAISGWALILAGIFHFTRGGLNLHGRSSIRARALAAGVLLPLVLNIMYSMEFITIDPAAALLAPAALMIRFAVIDPGLAPYLPLARSDVIEQLAVGVVVLDIRDGIIDANASARKFLGTDEPNGQPFEGLAEAMNPDIEVLRFPLHSHQTAAGSAAVLTDRSDAVRAQQQLQLAARLEALGSLTAGIAHEVNNPLAYVQANLNLIEKLIAELSAPELSSAFPQSVRDLVADGADSVFDAKDGIERISLLVERLKGFAREPTDPTPPRPLDLNQVVRRAVAVAGVGLPQGAIRALSGTSEPVVCSEHVVVQILVNLILNAIQACGDQPDVELEIVLADEEVELRVMDRGHGLDNAVLERVFDPFFTTKRSGTGLGLSISYDLATKLGARIAAANRPGGGAVFSLFMPRVAA